MPDEARDGRNVALIDKCFMVCSIVQRRIKLFVSSFVKAGFSASIYMYIQISRNLE